MPVYLWQGKNVRGEKKKGEMESSSEEFVRTSLRRMKIEPTKIKIKPKDLFGNIAFLQPKVKQHDIILFARQFSTMIDAGLPIIQCLEILYAQQENATFKKMLKSIKESVESGSTLAEALKKYPKQFDDLFVNMVAAGEAGGILDTILRRLSAYMEKAAKLKAQVKGAMTYPVVTLLIAAIVVAVILVFVIPVFQEMFADFGRNCRPLPKWSLGQQLCQEHHMALIGLIVFMFAFKSLHDPKRACVGRRHAPQAAGLRYPDPQGRRGQIQPHHEHHARQRGGHPGGPGYRGQNGRQQDHRKRHLQRPLRDRRGAHHGRPAIPERAFPLHGLLDDRRGRIHRGAGLPCWKRSPIFTTTKSIRPLKI